MHSYADQSSQQYTFDLNKSPLFQKDNQNYINIAGNKQVNSLKNTSLLDIFFTRGNVIEPHYHPNAAELVYCISGSVGVSMMNPATSQFQTFTITPGQIANVPQGWWHFEIANADQTHILAIFDAPNPEVVLGSDILKFTPASVMAHTYCLDENQWKKTTAPIQPSTYIGPYANCSQQGSRTGHYLPYPPYPYREPFHR
ncbi:cupin domain-containing protein [Metabacillus sp. GX 13764]|uniref:cupin domain-containing protein n=1 Tax=Metabacillus kandeliae TaxID=2900151 RepID=UPI001E5FC5BE|nr:cupin domain-containing protein [Metabacillus kandeliae]